MSKLKTVFFILKCIASVEHPSLVTVLPYTHSPNFESVKSSQIKKQSNLPLALWWFVWKLAAFELRPPCNGKGKERGKKEVRRKKRERGRRGSRRQSGTWWSWCEKNWILCGKEKRRLNSNIGFFLNLIQSMKIGKIWVFHCPLFFATSVPVLVLSFFFFFLLSARECLCE